MRFAMALACVSLISICYVTSAYAGSLDDLLLKFIYGTIALLIVAFTGCVTFIVWKFNKNVETLFENDIDIRRDIVSIKTHCAAAHGDSSGNYNKS